MLLYDGKATFSGCNKPNEMFKIFNKVHPRTNFWEDGDMAERPPLFCPQQNQMHSGYAIAQINAGQQPRPSKIDKQGHMAKSTKQRDHKLCAPVEKTIKPAST